MSKKHLVANATREDKIIKVKVSMSLINNELHIIAHTNLGEYSCGVCHSVHKQVIDSLKENSLKDEISNLDDYSFELESS